MPITPQDYNDDAIKGEQLSKLMEKEIRDRLKGDVPETLAHALCVMAAEIDALKAALAAHNLGERVADSLDAQTLNVGGVDVAESLASKQARIGSKGGPSQPVYFDANGNVQEIPVATGKTWLTLYVANANYSNSAGVANDYNTTTGSIKTAFDGKQDELPFVTGNPQEVGTYNIRVAGAMYATRAGALDMSAAVGGPSLPVYFTSNGTPHPCSVTQRTIGETSYEFVTIQAIGAYAATRLNTDAGGVGSDGYGQPVYVYNGVPVAIAMEAIGGANFVKIAAKLAYQASVALNANAVNGKKIVIGGYGGAADTIYFG